MTKATTVSKEKINYILSFLEEHQVQFLDVRFTDINGLWHHMSFPKHMVDATFLENGFCVDGSSIKGWSPINDSDVLVIPDVCKENPIYMDPFTEFTTAFIFAETRNAHDNTPYSRDPRNIAKKAQEYLHNLDGINTAYFGPEAEFFVFDSVA